MIRSKCAPWQSDRDLNEFVAEIQMDTAELSVKMCYEAAKVTWASAGMLQTDLARQLNSFVQKYDVAKTLPTSRSDAVLRPELQEIFSGCNVYYEPHQQNTYMATPMSNNPLEQKDWRWDTMLRRVWKFCPSRWHRDQVDNRRHPIDVLCDLDLNCKDRGDLSQHGAWCMDVLYTEACSRVGLMKQNGNYVALPNDAYVEAGT